MSITELIKSVGEDKVRVQFLHECMTRINKTREGFHVTFATAAVTPNDFIGEEAPYVCAIVWLPSQLVKDAVKASKAAAAAT